MGGNIETSPVKLDPGNPVEHITRFHGGTATPRLGGEIETMILRPSAEGYRPIAYEGTNHATARDILDGLKGYGYAVSKVDAGGRPYVLEGPQGNIVCFEKHAAVIERADGSFPGDANGMRNFLHSLHSYAEALSEITDGLGLFISPFDFDNFCRPEHFTNAEAPSPERYGENSLLADFDRAHPRIDEIDRRAVSCHFSMGFRDPVYLKRMAAVLTYLTPGLYAAYSTVSPTMLVGGHENGTMIDALAHENAESSGPGVVVPRALAWEIAAKERTGMPFELVRRTLEPLTRLEDIIDYYCSFHAIGLSPKDSFTDVARDPARFVTLRDYSDHAGTLWFDSRIGDRRLEARMVGTGIWKLESEACLLHALLMNEGALARIERVLNATQIKPEDIIEARCNVPFQGMKTKMGGSGLTVANVLELTLAQLSPPEYCRAGLAPLRAVVDRGKSDAELLLEQPDLARQLMDTPFSERVPLAMVDRPGAAFGLRPACQPS